MKKQLIYLILVVSFSGCMIQTEKEIVQKKILINDQDRASISGLINPVVDYTLLKDGEEYLCETGVTLTESDGSYSLDFNLLTGSSYSFSLFNISSERGLEYILDSDISGNSDGFTISVDGVFSVTPKVYLKKVSDIAFDPMEYENLSVEITTDESSFLEPVELTFKVSSNIPDATFKIYKYSIYWVSGPTLNQGEIFDMDTGLKFDPLVEGDGEAWGNDKFKIETTNSNGDTIFIVGFSSEWSKKHIYLEL